MDEGTQIIKEYINNLTPAVKQAVLSLDWHKKLAEIGQKYGLQEDKINDLEYEVLFVMIGMEPEEDLAENIERELGVSGILSSQLAEDIAQRIFQPISKSLESKQEIKTPTGTASSINISHEPDSWEEKKVEKPPISANIPIGFIPVPPTPIKNPEPANPVTPEPITRTIPVGFKPIPNESNSKPTPIDFTPINVPHEPGSWEKTPQKPAQEPVGFAPAHKTVPPPNNLPGVEDGVQFTAELISDNKINTSDKIIKEDKNWAEGQEIRDTPGSKAQLATGQASYAVRNINPNTNIDTKKAIQNPVAPKNSFVPQPPTIKSEPPAVVESKQEKVIVPEQKSTSTPEYGGGDPYREPIS